MSGTYIKVNGEWRLLPQDIKKNGSWEDVTNAWIKENGAWTLYRTENVPVEYLVVAGGGGGGGHDDGDPAGGGGGAGGFLTNVYGQDEPGATTDADSPNDAPDNTWDAYTLQVAKEYGIEVGTGGAGGRRGSSGNDSIFATITSIGGGGGGAGKNDDFPGSGRSGGSGGGKGADISGSGGSGTSYQGKNGGTSSGNRGGGGGGAGEYTGNTGKGGDGLQSNINGTPTYYAGGGGSHSGSGGLGGGGNGGFNADAGVGLDGSGGGGGGRGLSGSGGAGTPDNGAAGGDGVVIFRIPSVYKANFDAGIEFSSNRYDVPNYAVYNVTSGIGSFSIGYFDEFYTENSLFTFGWNNKGQLGDGTTTSKSSLTQISDEWIDITNGIDFTVGIKKDGTLWAWGNNNIGQLGTDTVDSSTTPVQIGNDTDWASVKAGSSTSDNGHILALKTNGTLWAWGDQHNGQLGNGSSSTAFIATPQQIGSDTDWASISAGDRSSAAIKTNGDLYTWGRGSRGRLGDGTTTEKPTPTFIGSGYKKVSCGKIRSGTSWGFFTVAIKTDGTLWTWGDQRVGQLGDGVTTNSFISTPQQIGSDTDWDKIATGGGFTLAIKTNKTLWGWGRNDNGQLGDGTKTEKTTPTQIGSGNHWKDVDCGERSALMITDGALWGTGLNNQGQISHLTTDQYYPLQISSSLETAWKKVSMGYRTSAVITGV